MKHQAVIYAFVTNCIGYALSNNCNLSVCLYVMKALLHEKQPSSMYQEQEEVGKEVEDESEEEVEEESEVS